jgi:hypothetical protein
MATPRRITIILIQCPMDFSQERSHAKNHCHPIGGHPGITPVRSERRGDGRPYANPFCSRAPPSRQPMIKPYTPSAPATSSPKLRRFLSLLVRATSFRHSKTKRATSISWTRANRSLLLKGFLLTVACAQPGYASGISVPIPRQTQQTCQQTIEVASRWLARQGAFVPFDLTWHAGCSLP